MATIGNIGKTITFSVSSKKVLTFQSLTHTVKGRWATHSLIGRKAKMEFLGSDLEGLTLKVKLSAMNGVKPLTTLNKIRSAVNKGTADVVVIGGKKIGSNKWIITNVSETWDCVYAKGELVEATVSLTLQEYV